MISLSTNEKSRANLQHRPRRPSGAGSRLCNPFRGWSWDALMATRVAESRGDSVCSRLGETPPWELCGRVRPRLSAFASRGDAATRR